MTTQNHNLKPDDLKPQIKKALDVLLNCNAYTSEESGIALQALREASDQQRLQSPLGEYLTKHGYAALLIKMYVPLKEACVSSTPNTPSSKLAASTLRTMMTAYAQFTTASVHLCTELGKDDTLPYLMTELKETRFPVEITDKDSQREITLILNILYHCIRHCSDYRVFYRKHDAVGLFTKFLDTPEVLIKTTSLIILAYVVDETESEKLATTGTDGCVNFLILRLKMALHSRIHRAGGFTAAGLLEGMIHLMASDANKMKVMEQGAVPLILRMIQRTAFMEEEMILAATALWKLAFIGSNRAALKKDSDIIEALEHRKTSSNAALRDACNGALWEIYEGQVKLDSAKVATNSGELHIQSPSVALQIDKQKSKGSTTTTKTKTPTPTVSPESDDHGPHIMISYQWDSQHVMIQLKNALQQAGYKIWMDVEKMEGNILAAMANAVEKAEVVIIAMSHKYKESNNCRTEASYAYKMKKTLVPLLVEDDYDPDGWLGALAGMLLYYKIISNDTLKKQLPLIIKELGDRGRCGPTKAILDQIDASPTPEEKAKSSKPSKSSPEKRYNQKPPSNTTKTYNCLDWTAEQVQEWLANNGLPKLQNALKLYDGKCLAQMHKLSVRCPEYFHNALTTELKFDFLSVIKFNIALDEITQE